MEKRAMGWLGAVYSCVLYTLAFKTFLAGAALIISLYLRLTHPYYMSLQYAGPVIGLFY